MRRSFEGKLVGITVDETAEPARECSLIFREDYEETQVYLTQADLQRIVLIGAEELRCRVTSNSPG